MLNNVFKSWKSHLAIMNSNTCQFFYGHTKEIYTGALVFFDVRCSMPPTSWEELKIGFFFI